MNRSEQQRPRNLAIACQGGGTHTAFTGGALAEILRTAGIGRTYRLVGISGTSGGAACALIVWSGLLRHHAESDPAKATAPMLKAFWDDDAAGTLWEGIGNAWAVAERRLEEAGFLPQFPIPEPVKAVTQHALQALLERHVPFADLPELLEKVSDHPTLYTSAVDVLSGEFLTFQDACPDPYYQRGATTPTPPRVTVEPILASAAVPPYLPSVPIDLDNGAKLLCWDGLYSYNPAIRCLTERPWKDRPDEIWVLQIDPEQSAAEPHTTSRITDRKFELASNLSLNGELHWIRQINAWIEAGILSHDDPDETKRFKPIRVARIPISRPLAAGLDLASKTDRSPELLSRLFRDGEQQVRRFLKEHSASASPWWEPDTPNR